MKVVVFTDVHGSLNSLKAFMGLEDFKTADKLIFLGDVSLGCSRVDECINLLKNIDCICLLGNNDGYVKVVQDECNGFKIIEMNNSTVIREYPFGLIFYE